MDATLKRRMWKVAIAHFLLTLLFIWEVARFQTLSFSLNYDHFSLMVWHNFWLKAFFVFQPQFLITQLNFVKSLDFEVVTRVVLDFLFGIMPLWSICFGWLFVKFDNWLNHFPVLGRKVF